MKLDYSPRFEHVIESFNRLYKAYQDGFIMEDEKVIGKWLSSMGELIVEMGDIRQLVGIQFYDEMLKKETVNRIQEIENELDVK